MLGAMVEEASTTVKVRVVTRQRIERVKTYPRETVDDVLTRLLDERDGELGAAEGGVASARLGSEVR